MPGGCSARRSRGIAIPRSASGGGRLDRDLEAQLGEAALSAFDQLSLAALIVIGGAEVAERLLSLQDVIEGDQDAMGDGDDGAFDPAAAGQAVEAGGEVGVLDFDRGPGGLHQPGAQPAVAMPGSAGEAFAGALVVAGAELGPTGEVSGRWKTGHVDAGFGQDILGQAHADAGYRIGKGDGGVPGQSRRFGGG